MSYFVHPSAIADEGCKIGAGSRIWHFSHIMSGACMGENCVIGQNVFVASGVVLGRNVHVQNNVSIYDGVTCEDDVFLGPSMVFTNVKNPRSAIARKNSYQPTVVRKGATIGANATVVCGIEIGAFALVGAGALVNKNLLPYGLYLGVPAVHAGWVSEYGHRLQFDVEGVAVCPESGEKYLLRQNEITRLT